MNFRKFDARGFAHHLVAILFVLIFAIGGVGYIVVSHANTVGTNTGATNTSSSVTTASGSPCVKTAQETSVQNIDSQGRGVGASVSSSQSGTLRTDLARRHDFKLDGGVVHQVDPPKGWSPITATAQELQSYGFPAKPTDPTALSEWKAAFANYKGSGAPGVCETNGRHGLLNNINDANWAGGVLIANNYGQNQFTTATGGWDQSGFKATCGSSATYAAWTGIGGIAANAPGWNYIGGSSTGGLLQAGTDVYGPTSNYLYAWYEAISTKYSFPGIAFTGSWPSVINPGDQVYSAVTYNTNNQSASFLVMDATKGIGWGTAPMNTISYNNQAVSTNQFYDGTSTDFISEAATVNNKITPLAQPYLGDTYFNYATANGLTIHNYKSLKYTQLSGGSGHPAIDSTTFNGSGTWHNNWQRCI